MIKLKTFTSEDIKDILLYMQISDYVCKCEISTCFTENIIQAWFHSKDMTDQVESFDYIINKEDEIVLEYKLIVNE